MLEIVVPAGHKGAYVPAVPSLNGAQFELLLARGAKFRVLTKLAELLVLEALP